jgi:hypothetical protein
MKKVALVLVVLAVLLSASAAYAGKPTWVKLDGIDIGTGDGLDGTMEWGADEPTYSGGSYGNCASQCSGGTSRVVWGPLNWPAGTVVDDTNYALLYLTWNPADGKARHIQLSVLDGIADDSFNVYVQNPGGDWALVYHYDSDPSTAEYWVTHDIYSFPAGKGQGNEIHLKIEATGAPWSGINRYGQLAVDWIEVWGF